MHNCLIEKVYMKSFVKYYKVNLKNIIKKFIRSFQFIDVDMKEVEFFNVRSLRKQQPHTYKFIVRQVCVVENMIVECEHTNHQYPYLNIMLTEKIQ